MTPKHDEENRKLAEWLGLPLSANTRRYGSRGEFFEERVVLAVPDFYLDEAASAMLLDKLLKALPYKQILLDGETCFTDQPRELNECEQDHEACIFLHLHIYIHADRKTAIAEACLKLIEKGQP